MKILVLSLITIACSTLLIAISNLFSVIPVSLIAESKMTTLPAIAISAGVLIASVTYLRDKSHQAKNTQRKSDEIYLNIARESFNEVFDLLKDKNNDRIIWVRASRLLLQVIALKSTIKTQDIIQAFEVSEERLRAELYRTLSIENDGDKNKQPLPPQFFYGIGDWETEKNLDNAALKGGGESVCVSVNIHENIPSPSSKGLAKQSVIAIYDFLEFPVAYVDPLEDIKTWDDNWEDSHGINQGAKRYVSHLSNNYVVGGKLHKKVNENKRGR